MGGLLNIMYADEHTYNVYSMYGFGFPYNGSLPSLILEKLKSILDDKGNGVHENFIKSPAAIYECEDGLSYVGKGLDCDYFPLVSAVGQPAIPHNLECRNPQFINAVLNDIQIG